MQRQLRARQVGGFVIPAPACDIPGLLPLLDAAGLRYVAISPRDATAKGPWVGVDERGAMQQLTQHLLSRGHRRIALLLGDPGTRGAGERLAGYASALADNGLALEPRWTEQAGYSFDAGREAAHRLLRRADHLQRPTAIMAASDDCAAGVIAAAHERGLSLPDELSVTGFDDLDLARKVWPGLTTVHQPLALLARAATERLIRQLQPHRRMADVAPAVQIMTADLVLRGSVRSVAAVAV